MGKYKFEIIQILRSGITTIMHPGIAFYVDSKQINLHSSFLLQSNEFLMRKY